MSIAVEGQMEDLIEQLCMDAVDNKDYDNIPRIVDLTYALAALRGAGPSLVSQVMAKVRAESSKMKNSHNDDDLVDI